MAYSDKQKFKPTNINYTSKDFSTIKADLIEYTKSYFPDTYKDFNETSPGMMLIELSSYVGDVLSYYVDYNYKENILSTATEKRNVRRLAEFLGYKTPNKTASIVKLKVTAEIDANDDGTPDYTDVPSQISNGLQIQSNIDSELLFETTGEIDFSISGSPDTPVISSPNLDANGEASSYTLTRYVQAVSAETKTKSFTITSPTKFLELDIGEDNVIEILNCTDSSDEKWYEVDYLSQERILKETYYNDDSNRATGYNQGDITDTSLISIPYTLDYINTNKKFVTKFDVDTNSTKLMFGNGLYKYNVTGSSNSSIFTTIEQSGITLNGESFSSINANVNDLLGTNSLNMGETPTNTILTVQYRVGGGPDSNAQAGELTTIADGTTGISVTNDESATGGTDGQTVDEIRHNAKSFFASQNRCVTRQDYQARILNLPAKFGNIAKCYVERIDDAGGLFVSTLSYNQNKQLVQTPELVLRNIMTYLNQYRMINDQLDFGFTLSDTLFSGYNINFGVKFEVNSDRRVNPSDVKIEVINTIKNFFKVERMQFRQSINMNDLQYNILGIEGVIGIKELKLFQNGNDFGISRNMANYQADGDVISNGESDYGFEYSFSGAEENGIIRPSLTPSVFELRDPDRDIYGKVI
tara:strand:- start:1109 stop:3031 length:1923 start_codon:yes stop_codon:yes gene_type:complete